MKIYVAKSPLNLKFVKNMHFGHFCITEGDRPFYFTVMTSVAKNEDFFVDYTIQGPGTQINAFQMNIYS